MKYALTIIVEAILLLAGQYSCAQEIPQTSPGINFWNWQRLSPETLQWIRKHNLKSVSKINLLHKPDTEKWVFNTSDDTQVVTFYLRKIIFIQKYDRNDTLRSEQSKFLKVNRNNLYDSLGGIIEERERYFEKNT